MISAPTTERHPVRTAYQAPPQVGDVNVYLDPEYVGTYVTICRDTEHTFLAVARRTEDDSGYRSTLARVTRTDTGWLVLRDEGVGWTEVTRTRGLPPALNSAVWSVSVRGHDRGWW